MVRYPFPMETLHYWRYRSAVGPLLLGISPAGLCLLEFDRGTLPSRGAFADVAWIESSEEAKPYIRELDEYFAGKRKQFTFALDLRGTDFQKRCWRALLAIPFGETRSYSEIARQIGSPTAVRAVGGANHVNPIAIVVPCHRVVGSSGSLTGYGGGLDLKKRLLELEGAWSAALALK